MQLSRLHGIDTVAPPTSSSISFTAATDTVGIHTDTQTQTNRQTDGQTDTDRQTNKQTDKHTVLTDLKCKMVLDHALVARVVGKVLLRCKLERHRGSLLCQTLQHHHHSVIIAS